MNWWSRTISIRVPAGSARNADTRPNRPLSTQRRTPAFTLLELLVVVSIVMILVGIMSTSILKVRSAARSAACKSKLKTVVFEFIRFADNVHHPYRGDSDREGGPGFALEDFQERLYGISEFWSGPGNEADYDPAKQLLMCPAGASKLTRRSSLPCSSYAVSPVANVSVGFNKRLERPSVYVGPMPVLRPVRLSQRVLDHPMVPLVFDVDGTVAAERRVVPYYSAPPLASVSDPRDPYRNGQLWFPSQRHGGETNAGFIGGHIASSRTPERSAGWRWDYQPIPSGP